MRIVTYNVHSCVGVDGRHAPERIAAVIAAIDPDVACLQELDAFRPRTSSAEQASLIAAELRMHFHFAPTISVAAERYGDAILTRMPLRLQRAAPFPEVPRPMPRESRGAIWVETEVGGAPWQIINTHLGLGREERRLQAAALLLEWLAPALAEPPVLLCGDFNSRPASRVHKILTREMADVCGRKGMRRPRTFPTRFPIVCLDYIFVSPAVVVREVQCVVTPLTRVASDHFPLVAELECG